MNDWKELEKTIPTIPNIAWKSPCTGFRNKGTIS